MNNEYAQNNAILESLAERSNDPRPEPMLADKAETELSMEWVLAKMEAIIHDNAHIAGAIKAITDMRPHGEHDLATNSKASSMAEVVAARESTNRQVLKFLEKIYDDLSLSSPSKETFMKSLDLVGLSENLESQHVVDIVKALSGVA